MTKKAIYGNHFTSTLHIIATLVSLDHEMWHSVEFTFFIKSAVYCTIYIMTLSLDGELLTETCYIYHPIKYQHIIFVITYIYAFLNYGFL
jgi:hypothetical protein